MSEQKKLIVSFSDSYFHEDYLGLVDFKEVIKQHVDLGIISFKDKVDYKVVRPYYINRNGSPIIFADECDTDVGMLKIDDYTRGYSKYLEDCDEREIGLIFKRKDISTLKEYAKISGFSELEIDLMCYFKDFHIGLGHFKPIFKDGAKITISYIDENYSFHKTKKSIKPGQKYLKTKLGYYTILNRLYRYSLEVKPDGTEHYVLITDDD